MKTSVAIRVNDEASKCYFSRPNSPMIEEESRNTVKGINTSLQMLMKKAFT